MISGKGSAPATKRIFKELTKLSKLDSSEYGFEATPVDDNLYRWIVKLFGFGDTSAIGKNLELHNKKFGYGHIELEIIFPQNFPWDPPFIRVVRPRFQYRTGHVTVGGSICMELLTPSGWMPTNSLEAVLVQIRSEMLMGEARLEGTNGIYTEYEAKAAFDRVARQHGWIK